MNEGPNPHDSYKTKDFMAYHARHLAVHKHLPWQVVTRSMCVLLTYKATLEEAKQAIDAMQADKDAGTLPNNLSLWDKHDQFLKFNPEN